MPKKRPAKRIDKNRTAHPTDSEMLDELLELMHEKLKAEDTTPKVADYLKVMELKHKLKITNGGRKKLLDLIESVREEELDKPEGCDESN
jgi:hypothetical protein